MNKPALYHQLNQLSSRDSHQIIQDYAEKLNWRPDGCDSVLDAGCGAGDITHGIILPFLPPHFERVVGVDVSTEMVEYARRTHTHPKLTFHQFDLGRELEGQSLEGVEPFDHIFSAFCLTWIRNPRICLETFHKLLEPNGDMLLWWSPNKRNAYEELAKNDRWSKYMTDIDRFIPQYQYWEHPETEFQRLLTVCGFTDCSVKVYDKTDNRSYEAMRSKCWTILFFSTIFSLEVYMKL